MAMTADREENISKAEAMVEKTAENGAEIVCLPELFSSRYFPSGRGNHPLPEKIPGPTTRALARMARDNGVILVGGSVYERSHGKNYNTCVVYSEEGKALALYRKVHLPQDEHYFEQDYFSPGEEYSVVSTSAAKIGTLICFDQWYPEAARINRLMGAQVLFYPTAIGLVDGIEQVEGDWRAAWEAVQVGHAVANSMVVCAVNRVGREGATRFWGSSFVCDQFGKVLFRAGREEGAFVVECDLQLGALAEDGWGFLRNRRSKTYHEIST
jgi:agmatine deiminase